MGYLICAGNNVLPGFGAPAGNGNNVGFDIGLRPFGQRRAWPANPDGARDHALSMIPRLEISWEERFRPSDHHQRPCYRVRAAGDVYVEGGSVDTSPAGCGEVELGHRLAGLYAG